MNSPSSERLNQPIIVNGEPVLGKGWIRVEDRLPDFHADILLFHKRAVKFGYRTFDFPWWQSGSQTIAQEEITHWMPLPNPPEATR